MVDGGLFRDITPDAVIGAHVTSLGPVGPGCFARGRHHERGRRLHLSHHRGRWSRRHGLSRGQRRPRGLLCQRDFPNSCRTFITRVECGACSAGVLHAGTAKNVVPRHASLQGTLRTFTEEQRLEAHAALRALADETSADFGVDCRLSFNSHTPPVSNHGGVNRVVERAARRRRWRRHGLADSTGQPE
jgi:metal-dependent amidase/aminoacylase/carboxypeptidase family protein